MTLESTFICLDTSGFMRNGDYYPTRLVSQEDAARFIIDRKLMTNPENNVGMIAGSSKGIRLLSSETDDPGKLLACLHGLVPEGDNDFISLLKTAKLALKHRKMTTGGKRVVVFVGSPIKATEQELKAAAVSLKRDNIAVDVIATGEIEDNSHLLKVFHDAVVKETDGRPNSHLVIVPVGILPLEMIMTSAMYSDIGAFGGEAGGVPASERFAEYGGIDPSVDPELAFAMQASLAEARALEEAAAAAAAATAATAATETIDAQTEGTTEQMAQDTETPVQESTTTTGESDTASSTTATAPSAAESDEAYLMSLVGNVPGIEGDPELLASLLSANKKPDSDSSKKGDDKGGK